jgi:hypothetical protein
LDSLDVHLATDKGAYVGIVIASPLRDDEVSRARLREKIEVTLSYFESAEYQEKYGRPNREHSRFWINVHYDSDQSMLELIEHYRAQIGANDITAVVNRIVTSQVYASPLPVGFATKVCLGSAADGLRRTLE